MADRRALLLLPGLAALPFAVALPFWASPVPAPVPEVPQAQATARGMLAPRRPGAPFRPGAGVPALARAGDGLPH